MTRKLKKKKAKSSRKPKVKNAHFKKRYAEFVEAGKLRFPGYKVWGDHIHAGDGYGIYFSDGASTSLYQVRSLMLIDDKPVLSDMAEVAEPERSQLLTQAFDAIDKAIKERTAAECAKK